MGCSQDQKLIQRASSELENLRRVPKHDGLPFPRNCRRLLYQIPGNACCVDCGNRSPEWASVTFGVLLCVNCSGRHRSYGVSSSRVRSIDMDAWSQSQVLALLEGGNQQMKQFFRRHHMHGETKEALDFQYKTKAARFYKSNLEKHVDHVAKSGIYHGRDVARRAKESTPNRDCCSTTRHNEMTATTIDVQ